MILFSMCGSGNQITFDEYNESKPRVGLRPVIALKSGITATQDENGIWQLGE